MSEGASFLCLCTCAGDTSQATKPWNAQLLEQKGLTSFERLEMLAGMTATALLFTYNRTSDVTSHSGCQNSVCKRVCVCVCWETSIACHRKVQANKFVSKNTHALVASLHRLCRLLTACPHLTLFCFFAIFSRCGTRTSIDSMSLRETFRMRSEERFFMEAGNALIWLSLRLISRRLGSSVRTSGNSANSLSERSISSSAMHAISSGGCTRHTAHKQSEANRAGKKRRVNAC